MEMSIVAILVGAFGVFAGWHWKLLHRAVNDVNRYKTAVRSAKKVERDHWGKALLFGVAALFILVAVVKMHS